MRFRKPPEELTDLYADVVKALAPNIRVIGLVGEGGMALVFVARDVVLRREVAVKLLSPALADDPVARKRFKREAEAIAAVSHPNLVNVYHVGELPDRGIPYFVMQFVDGPTLGMGSLRGRMLTEARVRRLLSDVAAGLAAAHSRKVFHRDIKPGNIVLDGETGRALVLDFGISAAYSSRRHSLGRRLTEEGMYVGTPTYMSPEQASGEDVTGKSDVYSLGVLAFELLVGRPPFDGSPVSVIASHMRQVPPRVDALRSEVSPETATLIARCLEKDPAHRPTAGEIVRYLTPGQQHAVEWPPPGLSRLRSAGARALTALASASVVVALFFAMLALWPEVALLRDASGTPQGLLRSFVLGAGLALAFGAMMIAAFYVVALLQRWRWAAAAGYPAWVLADVTCDTRRDTGALISGTGDFGFASGRSRRMMVVLRRVRAVIVALTAVLAAAGMAQAMGLLMSGAGPGVTFTRGWALSILAAYVLFFVSGLYELRVRRRERLRFVASSAADAAPPPGGELVTMWLAGAEKARRSLGS